MSFLSASGRTIPLVSGLITNRKSYIDFRLVPKSVTLNDLERRNGHYFAEFGGFRGHYVKVVD